MHCSIIPRNSTMSGEFQIFGSNPKSPKEVNYLHSTYYPTDRIWNYDKTSPHASRNGGGFVWARRGTRFVHFLIPNEREWLTNLTCINVAGQSIPSIYIFCGKRILENYIEHYKDGTAMAMQEQAWMTPTLFSHKILHFIRSLESKDGISREKCHLLILDGHNLLVILQVVHKCMMVDLDVLTLPSHTSHRLQPLGISVFRTFKHYFRRYKDA